jgi:hypothetical protein
MVHEAALLIIRRSWVRAPPAHQRLAERTLTTKVYAGTDPLTGREIRFCKTCKTERSVLHREPAPRRCSTFGTPPHGSATAAARPRCGTTPQRSLRPAGGAPPTSRSRPQNLLRDLLGLDLAVRYGCRSATWPGMTVRRIPSSASQTHASASRRPFACENLREISAAGLPGREPRRPEVEFDGVLSGPPSRLPGAGCCRAGRRPLRERGRRPGGRPEDAPRASAAGRGPARWPGRWWRPGLAKAAGRAGTGCRGGAGPRAARAAGTRAARRRRHHQGQRSANGPVHGRPRWGRRAGGRGPGPGWCRRG